MKSLILLSFMLVGCSHDPRVREADMRENEMIGRIMFEQARFHDGFEDSAQSKTNDHQETEKGIRSLKDLLRRAQHKI